MILTPHEHLSSLHDHILVVIVLRHLLFDVIHITIFRTNVTMMKYVFRAKPFDAICVTIFESDVIMMKHVVRIEPF